MSSPSPLRPKSSSESRLSVSHKGARPPPSHAAAGAVRLAPGGAGGAAATQELLARLDAYDEAARLEAAALLPASARARPSDPVGERRRLRRMSSRSRR